MIIVLKNANFSASNIGTLSSWRITRSLGAGATYEGVTSVDKGASFSATVTIAEGYELGAAGVTVTMGGTVISASTIVGNVITISIAAVTGNVVIKVPTVNTSTGEEDEGENGGGSSDVVSRTIPLNSICYTFNNSDNKFYAHTIRHSTYGNALAGDILEIVNPDNTYNVGCSAMKLMAKASPVFATGKTQDLSETFEDILGDFGSWGMTAATPYTFTEDTRFLLNGKDILADANRDFTNHEFRIFNLRRNYTKGQAYPIYSYIGVYDLQKNGFNWDTNLRACVVLDLKVGDIVATTDSKYTFDVYKLADGDIIQEEKLASGYAATTWTSNANQRILAIARNNQGGSDYNMGGVDPATVFTVTFNS